MGWVGPQILYLQQIGFPVDIPTDERRARGVTWIELAADFEISTWVLLSPAGPDAPRLDMRIRANYIADVSRNLRSYGARLLPKCNRCKALQGFGVIMRASLALRPRLPRCKQVGIEVGLPEMLQLAVGLYLLPMKVAGVDEALASWRFMENAV